MNAVNSFDATAKLDKQISDAFPSGKGVTVYDHGFRDALESTVLAMRTYEVEASIIQNVVQTAMDAFSNHVTDDDENGAALQRVVLTDAEAAGRTVSQRSDLHTKTSATGLFFFQELQEKTMLGRPFNKAEVASCFALVMRSDVAVAMQETEVSGLLPDNFVELLNLSFRDFGFTSLVHSAPEATPELTPFNVSVSEPLHLLNRDYHGLHDAPAIELLVQNTFDRLYCAGDQSVNRVWLARHVDPTGSPQAYEWVIHSGLVGVALPDDMFAHFMAQAALRASSADLQSENDVGPAPGQGG